jgi:hypothetical protein
MKFNIYILIDRFCDFLDTFLTLSIGMYIGYDFGFQWHNLDANIMVPFIFLLALIFALGFYSREGLEYLLDKLFALFPARKKT